MANLNRDGEQQEPRGTSKSVEERNSAILEKLKGLRKVYARDLAEKAEKIERRWLSLQESWQREGLSELERMVHSLTGSGKTYGFPEISERARALENLLRSFLGREEVPGENERDEAARLVQALLRILEESHRDTA